MILRPYSFSQGVLLSESAVKPYNNNFFWDEHSNSTKAMGKGRNIKFAVQFLSHFSKAVPNLLS